MEKYIIVTNWERVSEDEFYLSDEWLGKSLDLEQGEAQKIREQAKNNELSYAYIVPALSYALYWQMDAQQVFVDPDFNVVVTGESSVIDTNWSYKQEYDY